MAKAFDIIRETNPDLGLELNIHKTDNFGLRVMVVNFVRICTRQTPGDQC